MNEVFAAAAEVQQVIETNGWDACLIGGLAVIRWGRMRATQDADFSLLTGFGDEEQFIRVLAKHFPGRSPDEEQFALVHRVYRGFASNGAEIDIALACLPFEIAMIDRATNYEFVPGVVVKVCSAEDLIVMKAFAGRDQDWADIGNVAKSQWQSLDWESIESDLSDLCELAENLTSVPRLAQVRAELTDKWKRKRS